jgi:hypothetical protein
MLIAGEEGRGPQQREAARSDELVEVVVRVHLLTSSLRFR